YLNYRPDGTQTNHLGIRFYLKCRPDGTQTTLPYVAIYLKCRPDGTHDAVFLQVHPPLHVTQNA
ncbi:MAG TPA: hypothetical protein PKI63_09860, partial [Candidatus Cloacimonadota bacterium]|nr:hypothetical protein [Candidatus Cloacimonadota bacterium]